MQKRYRKFDGHVSGDAGLSMRSTANGMFRKRLFERTNGAWPYLRTVWAKSRFTKYLTLLDFDQEAPFPAASRNELITDRSFDTMTFNPQSGRKIRGRSDQIDFSVQNFLALDWFNTTVADSLCLRNRRFPWRWLH